MPARRTPPCCCWRLPLLVVVLLVPLIGALSTPGSTDIHGVFEEPHHQHYTEHTFPKMDKNVWCVKITGDRKELRGKIKELEARHNLVYAGQVSHLEEYHLLKHAPEVTNDARSPHEVHLSLQQDEGIEWIQFQSPRVHAKRVNVVKDVPPLPDDPEYPNQWHLKNRRGGIDLNVEGAWNNRMTGEGVGISIVDDGLEWRHDDFKENGRTQRYNKTASRDWNFDDDDPTPDNQNDNHGTQCGGVAFAGAFNGKCGVGAAYRATFSGQRLISQSTTDAMEAAAFLHEIQSNHIMSCSWGPTDDGRRLEAPGPLARAAFKKAIQAGRNGKGTIFVWAGGNGGSRGDNVNYDGYANSIYTLAIAAVDKDGKKTSYSEPGAALLASGPSSPPSIYTTAINGQCSHTFSGTSATAPMIAGVLGLVLQANSDLTWRDVQNILIKTSRKNDPNDPEWTLNGARRFVSHKYGYGLIDATAAVNMAASYTLLPPARANASVYTFTAQPDIDIPDDKRVITTSLRVEDDFFVEHVELVVRLVHGRRGDLLIELVSPAGTVSTLFVPHGDTQENVRNWKFTSMRCWEESSRGTWAVRISDQVASYRGQLNAWQLILNGRNTL